MRQPKIQEYSSSYTRLSSSVLFPLHEALKKHSTVKVRKELERTQWLNAQQLKKLQLERLVNLLQHAQAHVPYYRELFARLNIDCNEIQSLAFLKKIPFLDKVIIRENYQQLKSDIPAGLAKFNTGGSSGQPLNFFIGLERVSHDVAAKWRATRWWGVDIGDPEIVVWGSPIELGAQDKVRLVRDKLLRTQLLPAFELSEEKLNKFLLDIKRIQPKMLFGYPSALSRIAKFAIEHNIDMTQIGIKVAFVTSEYLYPEQREVIESCFACPVANGYGGRDAGFIAHECPAGNMHITAEDIIVEIIDSNGNNVQAGESGEIVVTHLATSGYPFIRYKTGDIGVLDDQPCSCGRGLPLLKEIQGRTSDFVVSQNGVVIHGSALRYILREYSNILEYKIIQETKEMTRVLLVTDDGFSFEHEKQIVSGFKARLGDEVEIKIEYIDQIPAEKSGKFRFVISHAV
jgi:phenylacetate-CoA ligase